MLRRVVAAAAVAQARVFVLVDALDECDDAQWQRLVAELLRVQQEQPALRLMLTMGRYAGFIN